MYMKTTEHKENIWKTCKQVHENYRKIYKKNVRVDQSNLVVKWSRGK